MSNARRMNLEEILSLPLGAVVWYEERYSYSNEQESIYGIPFYFLFPVMVSDNKNFTLIGAFEGSNPRAFHTADLPLMQIWDKKPEQKQIMGFHHWDLDTIPDDKLRELSDKQGEGLPALKNRIIWEYGSIYACAYRLGMNAHTLGKKLNGKTEFKFSEISAISKDMNFSGPEIERYFFTDDIPTEKIS